ncbi:hypothetical protein ADL06_15890 [Streptomyces sp. NRRL F-6491]|nr:hypothetical protein ADL06_15890 [Streptomyces sp. NRRL F-6491]KOX51904.1 hypothetical protein ADL08_03070 [Streptomyces sp. NRRL F-6492]
MPEFGPLSLADGGGVRRADPARRPLVPEAGAVRTARDAAPRGPPREGAEDVNEPRCELTHRRESRTPNE